MFERRLKLVLCLPVFASAVLITRLFQLQVLRGEEYAQRAEAALISPRQYLPPLRGRILDRFGRALVSDEPAHDVTVHYGALAMDPSYLHLLASGIRAREPAWRRTSNADLISEATRRIAAMWLSLERASGVDLAELRRRRDAICESVEGLRRFIWEARRRGGADEPAEKLRLREEELFHPIVRDIAPQARTRIELELGSLPFVRIEPSVRRVWHDGSEALCHVLGQIGPATARMVEEDPYREDALKSYRADDLVGISGVERLAEDMLRGRRGYEERFLDGRLRNRLLPIDGLDVQLTVDAELQNEITRILSRAVDGLSASSGASCVVLDVETREILALASVPTYDRAALRKSYAALRDDTRRAPLRFRAVAEEYQPGSIMKPVALLAGFAHDLVDPAQRVACCGALSPDSESWHCWTHWRKLPGHGELNGEEALQHSCNVYFYTLGQRINAKRLTDFYRAFLGLCPPDESAAAPRGTGLIEERFGLIPTLEWLRQHRARAFRVADARNYAIGQGELQITPLQAANIFATLAAGVYRDPSLIVNDGRPRETRPIRGVSKYAWDLVRRGLFRCVNEEGGTAFRYARMDDLQICGKTGSAECVPRVTSWHFTFAGSTPDAMVSIEAPTVEAAREKLGLPANAKCTSRKIARTWPPPDPQTGDVPTHAWFAGYAPCRAPRIAVAIVIEYGGGGGSTAGTVAREAFSAIARSPHGYLPPVGGHGIAQAMDPDAIESPAP